VKILRVFPRRTAATPDDDLVRVGFPDLFPPECDEIHVSVTFTYDLPKAERVAEAWRHIAPVKVGGPALNDKGGEFVPGRYLKPGYVITSRGCPNRCWFCFVPKREGPIRELPITEGWCVQDNNLLACSPAHIEAVFEMLARQPHRAVFDGGLEAARLTDKIACRLALLNPNRFYLAYDSPAEREPITEAIAALDRTGHRWGHSRMVYVLIGYPHDSFEKAEERLRFCLSLGTMPFAMLYRDEFGKVDQKWRRFQREWCRPTIVGTKLQQAEACSSEASHE